MSEADEYGPEARRTGIPRDLPDQEADQEAEEESEEDGAEAAAGGGPAEELPDTDEAGSGPRRAGPRPAEGDTEPPEPAEPTD